MNSLFAGMYMMFFTTKLTRTTTFALLNQRYYNLLYQTIYHLYQTVVFFKDIVAGHPVIMIQLQVSHAIFIERTQSKLFFSQVLPSQRQGQKQEMYDCWVAINKSLRWILTGNCTWMAGYFNFIKSDLKSEAYLGSTQNPRWISLWHQLTAESR